MVNVAFFTKRGQVVRSSTTDFTPRARERLFVIDEEAAKAVLKKAVIPAKGVSEVSLYDEPTAFYFQDIPKEILEDNYQIPTLPRRDRNFSKLLGAFLSALRPALPAEMPRGELDLLIKELALQEEQATVWARLVYSEDTVTITDGEGVEAAVEAAEGQVLVTFETPFEDDTKFGVWVTTARADTEVYVENAEDGATCTVYLRNLSDQAAVTDVTFNLWARGKLQPLE
jgi:hypothetical protein